jgi:cytochrome c556
LFSAEGVADNETVKSMSGRFRPTSAFQAADLQLGGYLMRRLILAISAVALAATAALADPISERQAIMKSNGKTLKSISAIAKGEQPFDADKVLVALKALNDDAQKFDVQKLFPDGSQTGGDTTASPKIWEDTAGFQKAVDKFKADTASAVSASPADLDQFKIEFGKVAKNCGSCHEAFRIKKG